MLVSPVAPQASAASPQEALRPKSPSPWSDQYIATQASGKVTGSHVLGAQRQIAPALLGVNIRSNAREVQVDLEVSGKVIEPGFEGRTGYSFTMNVNQFFEKPLFKASDLPLADGTIGGEGAHYTRGHLIRRQESCLVAPAMGLVGPQNILRVKEFDATISPDLRQMEKVHISEYQQVEGRRPVWLTDATFCLQHSTQEAYEDRLKNIYADES